MQAIGNLDAPEFELRKPTNERAELVGFPDGKRRAIVEIQDLRIHLGGEKADQKIEDVNSEAVRDDVESFDEVNPKDIDRSDEKAGDPTVEDVWGTPIEEVLIPA